MSWGAYIQSGKLSELEELGGLLSIAISCPVHYPAFNKPVFQCNCGVTFPLYALQSGMWEAIVEKHNQERELMIRLTDDNSRKSK